MYEQIQKIKELFDAESKAVGDVGRLEALRIKFLGRKEGLLTELFEKFKTASIEDKRQYGPALNELKKDIEGWIISKQNEFLNSQSQDVDLTVPNSKIESGHFHPISAFQKEINDVFLQLGFNIEHAPQIESDYYNFESLNIPENHPARDMQDTFYLDLQAKHPGKKLLLRTHISNSQVRYMEKHKPPFAFISPGIVFRNEALDASHEHTYQYMEGVVVGPNANFSTMAWTLDQVMKKIFGDDIKTKLLPSYFPFVEPGAEMAISCLVCKGKGCSVCKHTGWVEILGCGMINQKVFEAAGYKKNQYQGFAFGFGVARLALMKYSIPDVRYFAENDLRFLNQF